MANANNEIKQIAEQVIFLPVLIAYIARKVRFYT